MDIGGQIAALNILLTANTAQANAALAKTEAQLRGVAATSGTTSKTMSSRLATAGKAFALFGVAAGAALYKVGKDFDDAYDKIEQNTGATGKQLKALKQDFREVVSDVPADFGSASTAVSDLTQRLHLSDKPLQKMSKQMLELSRMTDTDLSTNIEDVSKAFRDWDVPVKDMSKTLDGLFRLSQKTGISVGNITSYIQKFGSPLRQLGFTMDEAAAMFANFERSGVNIQTMVPGLKLAISNLTRPTEELGATMEQLGINVGKPAIALQQIFDLLSGDKLSQIDKTGLAMDVFGKRAGADMAEAIKQGRFEFDDLMKVMKDGQGTILKTGRKTWDFSEQLTRLKNNVLLALEPVAKQVFGTLSDEAKKLNKIISDKDLTGAEKFAAIMDEITSFVAENGPKVAEAGAKLGIALAKGIADAFIHSNVLGKIFIGAGALRVFGGAGVFSTLGGKIGAKLGPAIATKLAGIPILGKLLSGTVGKLATPGSTPLRPLFVTVVGKSGLPGGGGTPIPGGGKPGGETPTGWKPPSVLLTPLKYAAAAAVPIVVAETIRSIRGDWLEKPFKDWSDGMKDGVRAMKELNQGAAGRIRAGIAGVGEGPRALEKTAKLAKTVGQVVASSLSKAKKGFTDATRGAAAFASGTSTALDKFQDKNRKAFDALSDSTKKTGDKIADFGDKAGDTFDKFTDKSKKVKDRVGDSFLGLASVVTHGLDIIINNTNKALQGMGVKKIAISLAGVGSAAAGVGKQRGGIMVPGTGSGDKVPAMLEPGEVVLNRKAVAAMGGATRADRINKLVPRFAKGGKVGGMSAMLSLANQFDRANEPYQMGGGHGAFLTSPSAVDCSGAVSAILHAGGLLQGAPMDTVALAGWGKAAKGNENLVVATRPLPGGSGHTVMSLNGRVFGTSGENPGGGAGWLSSSNVRDYVSGAVLRTMGVAGAIGHIARVLLKGPDGPLKDIGQGALDKTRNAANRYIQSMMPKGLGGGGDIGRFLGKKPIKVTASEYGGGPTGAGGYLPGFNSFAELSNDYWNGTGADFSALGGLPMHSKLRIGYRGKSLIGEKRDVGAGGPGLHGYKRAIDLYTDTANKLGFSGLDIVQVAGLAKGGSIKGSATPSGPTGAVDTTNTMPLVRAKRIADRLRNLVGDKGKIAQLDEQIGISETLAQLESSAFGSDLSPDELAKQIALNERLLEVMVRARKLSRTGLSDLKHYKGKGGKGIRDLFNATLLDLTGVTGKGGRIFDTKVHLDELKGTSTAADTSQQLETVTQLLQDVTRRLAVSQKQYGVFAATPISGAFAKGGTARRDGTYLVGERGPEVVGLRAGQTVTPTPTLTIEELNVYADGTVGVKVGGKEFEAAVRRVNRKDARKGGRVLPGRAGS